MSASRLCPKVIRSQATEFRYEQSRQPLPRINPWRDPLEGLLLENEGKPARGRLTLIRIFEELRAVGYEGSYDAVRRYAKRWRAQRGAAMAEAFVPLSFRAGRGLPIRLVARDRADQRGDGHRQCGACPAVPQPHRHRPLGEACACAVRSGRVVGWDEDIGSRPLRRVSVAGRDHQPFRLAVFPFPARASHG